jgi:acetyl esterase
MTTAPTPPAQAAPLASGIRAMGNVIDVPASRALYAPLAADAPREGVMRQSDVRYGPDERHLLDVYRPTTTGDTPPPILVFFHGGGFLRGDRRERANAGWAFADQGAITVVPSYRLAPAHGWPAGAQDVAAVHAWVREHASELGGDPRRIFLCGESAGAAHVAASTLVRRFQAPVDVAPAGVLLISGVYDARLEFLARAQFGTPTPDPRNDAYFGADPARLAERSTIALVDAAPVPLLITYAELDPPQMQVQAGALFARLVTRHGFAPELAVIANHGHLSQVFALNTADTVLRDRVLDFIRRH